MDEDKKTCVCGADCEGATVCPACGTACPAATEAGANTEEELEATPEEEEVV